MVLGIGIDLVEIARIERMLRDRPQSAFLRKAFTPAELAQAPGEEHLRARAAYLASRFAAKEAVFKAVAHLTPQKHFDLRVVETLHREDGSPYISVTEELAPVCEAAGVNALHVSLTDEGDYAAAFVVACRESGAEEIR